jgi:hypothetical protein
LIRQIFLTRHNLVPHFTRYCQPHPMRLRAAVESVPAASVQK